MMNVSPQKSAAPLGKPAAPRPGDSCLLPLVRPLAVRTGLNCLVASRDLGDPFDGLMSVGDFGPVRLCRIAAEPHREGAPGSHTAQHGLPYYKLVLQLSGRAQLEQSARRTVLSAGKWSIYDVSRPYTMRNLDNLNQLAILLPKRKQFDEADQLLRASGDECFELGGMASVLFDTAGSALDHAGSIGHANNAELGEILAEMAKLAVLEHLRGRPRVSIQETARERIKSYILRNLRDEDLSLDRIAAALSCSKRYLHKVFSEGSGTLAQFIWELRLDRCREDLLDPRLASQSITQIAFSWGFTNSAHFSRAFRNRFGVSARACRRDAANPPGLSEDTLPSPWPGGQPAELRMPRLGTGALSAVPSASRA